MQQAQTAHRVCHDPAGANGDDADSAKLIAHALLDTASTARLRLEVFSVGHHAHTVGRRRAVMKSSKALSNIVRAFLEQFTGF